MHRPLGVGQRQMEGFHRGTKEKGVVREKARKTFLPFCSPCIGEEEIAEVVDTLRSDWIATGPKVNRFEQEFALYMNAASALAVNSGTAALHLALVSTEIGPGDAVITTPMTFCSTVHVIEQVGARPILVDVEPDTLNIDPNKVEEALQSEFRNSKSEIKAILPVHLYGHPCEMDRLLQLAQEQGLSIVEDAAHALPAGYKGRLIGSYNPQSTFRYPHLVGFSFYTTKNLTTAEGGMLVGPSALIEKARVLSLHGMNRDAWKRYSSEGSWYYEVVAAGFKYNMTDIAASLGLHQLKKLSPMKDRRRQIAEQYNKAFSPFEELQIPVARPEVDPAWHIYVLRLNPEGLTISRNQFIEELKARNIGASVHFIPVHVHPYYRHKYGFKPDDFPVAYQEYQRMLSLPLYPKMKDRAVEDVIDAVHQIVQKFRR